MNSVLWWLSLLSVGFVSCAPPRAIEFQRQSICQLTRNASKIIEGNISSWSASQSVQTSVGPVLESKATIDVIAVLRGLSPPRVVAWGPFEARLMLPNVSNHGVFFLTSSDFIVRDQGYFWPESVDGSEVWSNGVVYRGISRSQLDDEIAAASILEPGAVCQR